MSPSVEEYELKARLEVPVKDFRTRLAGRGWELTFRGRMSDRRLDDADRSLEARDEVLRIRHYEGEGGDGEGRRRTVVAWKGPARRAAGFKLRDEIESRVGDGEAVVDLLARLGYDRVTLALDRRVEILRKGAVTIRLERYPRMDVLIEIEGPPDRVRTRLPETGLPAEAWKAWPLCRFVEDYEARTGRSARLADVGAGVGTSAAVNRPAGEEAGPGEDPDV